MPSGGPEELEPRLAAVLEDATGDGPFTIRNLTRMSGGASRQTWAFEASTAQRTLSLILRLAPTAELVGGVMLAEAAAMREAARVGVPEPEVLTAQSDPDLLGAPFVIMTRVEGETIARRILREERYAAIRPALAGQCGRILAALHTMDPAALPALPDIDPLDALRGMFDATGMASPTLELAFRWLAANRPASGRRTVVHGDFRNGNLIVGPDGVRAVLDWELLHLGDPVEDLGWLCTKAWRFGTEPPVGGFGEYDDLLAAYEAASGHAVPRETLKWWELYGTVRWGVICVMQADRHLSGAQRSVELVTIGRRLAEQEYDCIALLEELS
jgi:aminoglycoside phosphotransferase (APT) family kinase protein